MIEKADTEIVSVPCSCWDMQFIFPSCYIIPSMRKEPLEDYKSGQRPQEEEEEEERNITCNVLSCVSLIRGESSLVEARRALRANFVSPCVHHEA